MYVILDIYSVRLEAKAIVNENDVDKVKEDIKEMYKKDMELVDIIEELESKYDCNFAYIDCLVLE